MEKLLKVLMLCLLVAGFAQAQTYISGPQSGTLGPGLYIVEGNIRVMPGETLTIVPGTDLQHNGNWKWEIYGQLNAEGTESDSIYFVRQNPVGEHRWASLRFMEGAADASTIDYCVIDNCNIPSGTPSTKLGGGIYTNGVDITVTNSRISNCDAYWHGGGIYASSANIVVDYCLIVDNTATSGANGGGIYLMNCDNAVITNSEIARNSATGT
ncbi:hypothetical protein CEE37_06050 [candidate division LCP-89 bacterium B3_LCP]|uniref:Right handed beta helix domain-containing protein n=1 Tax=candidate division LCP-89 bacterium B3_LCP TaxID=2012998 RepID=A0A532V204_UNCL8|nr:MAG: hypothetical protein CEE37_06050 [candidate division LCP-89 bacterium B3_LCP]